MQQFYHNCMCLGVMVWKQQLCKRALQSPSCPISLQGAMQYALACHMQWLTDRPAPSSGLFIVSNLKTTIYEAAPARAVMLLATMLGFHACIGLALRLYFFRFKLPAGAVDTAG